MAAVAHLGQLIQAHIFPWNVVAGGQMRSKGQDRMGGVGQQDPVEGNCEVPGAGQRLHPFMRPSTSRSAHWDTGPLGAKKGAAPAAVSPNMARTHLSLSSVRMRTIWNLLALMQGMLRRFAAAMTVGPR